MLAFSLAWFELFLDLFFYAGDAGMRLMIFYVILELIYLPLVEG